MAGVNLVVLAQPALRLLGVGTWLPRGAAPCLSQALPAVLSSCCWNSSLERSFLQIRHSKGMVLEFSPCESTKPQPRRALPLRATPHLYWHQMNPISALPGTSRPQHNPRKPQLQRQCPVTCAFCTLSSACVSSTEAAFTGPSSLRAILSS